MAFGVFQSYYSSLPEFKDDKNIPTIGALTVSLSYLGVPLTNAFALRFPHLLRHMVIFGTLGALLSLVLASFATQVWHLVVTQGFLYGFFWVIGYTPFLILIPDWFDKRRGLAYGIFFGSSGISGLILPFALETSCHRLGFRTTLRGFVVLSIIFAAPGFLLIKPRTPVGHPEHFTSTAPKTKVTGDTDSNTSKTTPNLKLGKYAFVYNPYFYFFAMAVFLQSLAYFLPPTFLPSYATALNLSPKTGDILLAINNLAQVCGQMLLGHLTDKIHPHIPVAACTLTTGVSALTLWGLAKTLPPLGVFSGVWGFAAMSSSTLWYRAIDHLTRSGMPQEVFTVYGVCSFERGIALLAAGPLASALLGGDTVIEDYGIGMYKMLIIFTACALLVSSTCEMVFLFEKKSKTKAKKAEEVEVKEA